MNTSCVPLLSTKSPKTCVKKLPFTSSERELIVALVRDRPIIEDKRTHAQNIELKKKAWDELTVAYNAQSYVTPRNNIQLKRCWENIKSSRKKELSFESINMRRTGGGPPEGGPGLSSDNVVDAICPFINLTVPGVIDSNSIEISDDLTQTEEAIKKTKINNVVDLEVVSDKPVDQKMNTKIVTNFHDSENCTEVMNVDNNFISDVGNNVPSQPKKRKEISTNNTGLKKICNETEARIRRCNLNMQQDSELHELRLNRERILLKREENLIKFEKQHHDLELTKIKLEIELLKKQLQN